MNYKFYLIVLLIGIVLFCGCIAEEDQKLTTTSTIAFTTTSTTTTLIADEINTIRKEAEDYYRMAMVYHRQYACCGIPLILYNSSYYENALNYIQKARDLYLQINDSEHVSSCDTMKELMMRDYEEVKKWEQEIEGLYLAPLKNESIEEIGRHADEYYHKAIDEYMEADCKKAVLYAQVARRLYYEINESDKVKLCDTLISHIGQIFH